MCHIQVHRRSRAVTRLAATTRAGKLTGQTIQHYIIPVLWPLLQQQVADKGLSGRMVGGQGIVDATVDCLGACAGVMGWRACVSLPPAFTHDLTLPVQVQRSVDALLEGAG
jgi:hypothetical protein